MALRRLDALAAHLPAAPPPAAAAPAGAAALPASPPGVRGCKEYMEEYNASPVGPRVTLTDEEKRRLYRDGFIVLRGIIPRAMTERARKSWNVAKNGREKMKLRHSDTMLDLVNRSSVGALLRNEMGDFSPTQAVQVGVTPPMRQRVDELKMHHLSAGMPYPMLPFAEFGKPHFHIDGLWDDDLPKSWSKEMDPATGKPRDPKWLKDESANVIGRNTVPLWQDKEKTLSCGSFTAFVFIPLNDQMVPGRGQTTLLRGAHHAIEDFFQMQVREGGPVGPEGPGWPRFSRFGDDHVRMHQLPDSVTKQFTAGAEEAGGHTFPYPTPILMQEGDCCITLHACPHGGSLNTGPDPRMNIIIRIRRKRDGDPNEGSKAQLPGGTDYPDREWGTAGRFLEYPPGYNPWKISIEKMCDHWSEWRGMQRVVEEERAKARAAGRRW